MKKKLILFFAGVLMMPVFTSCGGSSKDADEVAQMPVEDITAQDAAVLVEYISDFTSQLQKSVEDKDSKKLQQLMGQLADSNTVAIISKFSQLSDDQIGEEGMKVRADFQETMSKVLMFGINAADSADIE